MDRLTARDKNGTAVMRLDLPKGMGNGPIARLADYEDTGLTPDEIMGIIAERDAAVAEPAGGRV